MGWESGRLGYPIADEYGIPGGRRNDFVHGRISYFFAGGQIHVGER
jgi:uncharacterized protein with LGFP repeats